jgi:hypothetical protein
MIYFLITKNEVVTLANEIAIPIENKITNSM